MSLMTLIAEYDREREAYIIQLETDLEKLRTQNNELTSLLMSATAANERKTLELILSGHFDRVKTDTQSELTESTGG